MKRFLLCVFLLSSAFAFRAEAKADPVVQIRASDFLIMYLNSQLAKNPTLSREGGWGLHFLLESGKDKPQIKAAGAYFESSQAKELENAVKAGELFFNDLTKRYKLEGKFEWKAEINKAALKN